MPKDTKVEPRSVSRMPSGAVSLDDPVLDHFKAVLDCNEALCKGMLDIVTETLAFAGRRISANLEVCAALGACQSADDLHRIQTRFATAASQEYLEQWRHIGDLTMALNKSISARMEQQISDKGANDGRPRRGPSSPP